MLKEDITLLHVKNQIKETLNKFEIDEKQVLSICVDNAANMTYAVNKLGDYENIFQDKDEKTEDIEEMNVDISPQWIKNPSLILPAWTNDNKKIQLMRCGIHTLQLAIWDGLKNERITKTLGKIQQVVVKLRTPTIRNVLLKMYGKTQFLDTVTRWGYTYAMLDRLLFFKDYCDQIAAAGTKDLQLSKAEWDEVKHIRAVLEKPNISTIALQATDLTPGMFMKEWCKLEKCMEEFGGYAALEFYLP
ncbi:uncharacterized protein [Centruroides vittatus]|uniref:uncharacterized protein n=1 Tax=Centruroides vittatus TaxID=120091 RepID=UPI003510BEC8